MSGREYPTIAIAANEFPAPGLSPVGTVVRQPSDERPALVRPGLRNGTAGETTIRTAPPLPFSAFRNRPDDPHRTYLITEDEEGFRHGRDGDGQVPRAPVAGFGDGTGPAALPRPDGGGSRSARSPTATGPSGFRGLTGAVVPAKTGGRTSAAPPATKS